MRIFDINRIKFDFDCLQYLSVNKLNLSSVVCFLPWIFYEYEKIVFISYDSIINSDVADLYYINLSSKFIAASKDLLSQGALNLNCDNRGDYLKSKLKLHDPWSYFNTSVFVLNITEIISNYKPSDFVELLDEQNYSERVADIFNYLFSNNVLYLDYSWNFPVANNPHLCWLIQYSSLQEKQKYKSLSHKDIHIFSFSSSDKPWIHTSSEYSYIFWGVCTKSIYYNKFIEYYSRPKDVLVRMHSKHLLYIKYKLNSFLSKVLPKKMSGKFFAKKLKYKNYYNESKAG